MTFLISSESGFHSYTRASFIPSVVRIPTSVGQCKIDVDRRSNLKWVFFFNGSAKVDFCSVAESEAGAVMQLLTGELKIGISFYLCKEKFIF